MREIKLGAAGGILFVGALAGSANATEALVFDNTSVQETTVHGDWASNQFKAECANKWLTGLSENETSHAAHAALCDQGARIAPPTSGWRVLDFSQGDNRPSPFKSTDWDPGFYKAECSRAAGEAVVGVAQTTSLQMTKIACMSGAVAGAHFNPGAEECTVITMFDTSIPDRDANGNLTNGLWSSGNIGECPGSSGYQTYLRGVSRDTLTGAPHALLCCLSGAFPPP
jgi:hypothetical protein